MTRRQFVRLTAHGALAATASAGVLYSRRVSAQQKTLKILQWSHFVPGYDKWFDGIFTKEWGSRNNTKVIVDHISLGEISARAAAEVSARRGHDLFMFLSPPAAYEKQVLDLREVVQTIEKRYGKMIPLAEKSTFNPKTNKYFAFSDSYIPDPGNYRRDLWEQVGYPNGPDTWEDLRIGGKKIKERFGNPVGVGLSQEQDSNMAVRALLWSYGGAEQDAQGNVTLYSQETIEAVKFARALYKETMTPEVFTWDASSNNRGILAGKLSFVCNAISVTRTAEKENPDMSARIYISEPLQGPARRIAAENGMSCYVIWNFAENKEGAQQFLVDLVDHYEAAFKNSEFYSFPCFPSTVPALKKVIADDPKASPPDKYKVLGNVLEWANIGYPGYATAATDEIFNTFVLPTMFARAARDELRPEQAVRTAEKEVKRIFAKWRT